MTHTPIRVLQWTLEDGAHMTAMPSVNAIPAVCAARPDIVTYRDLPLVTAAGNAAPTT